MPISEITNYLPVVIPIVILQFVLAITAIVHICKHPNYKFGNKVMWIIIAICLELLGPIIYFVFGKGDD